MLAPRLLVALLAAAGLLSLPTLALGGASGSTAGSKTFQDAKGEDPAGPDITQTVVSNDDGGLITFKVSIPNRATFSDDMLMLLFLDTGDGGDPDSLDADYAIQLAPDGVGLFKWNGTDFLSNTPQQTLRSSYASGTATFTVDASELGGTRRIAFFMVVLSGLTTDANGELDFTTAHRDIAPTDTRGDADTWSYDVRTKLVLAPAGFTTSPAPVRAGGPFSVGLAATRNDTKGLVRAGTVGCSARIGTVTIAAQRKSVANGVATCAWTLPASARGKTVRGTITLVVGGARLTRDFAVRVR